MLRTLVVSKTTTLKALTVSLSGDPAGMGNESPAVDLASLRRLNPHVADLDRIPAGTVLIVPDTPKSRAATTSITGQGFGQFADLARQAVEAGAKRVDAGHGALAEQQKDVAAALKSAAVKKQVDADADLKKLVADSDAVFKADQQSARAAQQTLDSLQRGVAKELAVLAKMFG